MKINDHIEMKGRLTLQLYNRSGAMVKQQTADNDIVLTGRELVAKLFIGQNNPSISHLAVGIGTTDVAPNTDVALAGEIDRIEIVPISPIEHLTVTTEGRMKVTVTANLDFLNGNGTLTEAGLFNAPTAGIMYNRVVFPAVNKTSDFKLTMIWEILF